MKIFVERSKTLFPRIDVIYFIFRVMVFLGIAWYALSVDHSQTQDFTLVQILVTFFAHLAVLFYAIGGKIDIKLVYLSAIAIDIILIPTMILFTGGIDSSFYLMYYLTLSIAVYVLTFWSATMVASIATVSFLAAMSTDFEASHTFDIAMRLAFIWAYFLSISYASEHLRRSEKRLVQVFDALNHRTSELEKSKFQLEMIYENSRILSSILDSASIVRETMKIMGEFLGYDAYAVIFIDGNKEPYFTASSSNGKSSFQPSPCPLDGMELIQEIIVAGEPVCLKNILLRSDYKPLNADARSLMIVPLTSHSTTIGILLAESNDENKFNDRDVQLLSIVARSAALGLENDVILRRLEIAAEESRLPNQALPVIDDAYEENNKKANAYPICDGEFSQVVSETLDVESFVKSPVDYSKLRGKTIRLLAGDSKCNMVQFLSEWIPEYCEDFKIKYCDTIEELYSLASTDKYDFAILVLNNIHGAHGCTNNRESYCEERLELVSFLCSMGVPVIALYGSPPDESFAKRVVEAGATFASLVPCSFKRLEKAILMCLDNSDLHPLKQGGDYEARH